MWAVHYHDGRDKADWTTASFECEQQARSEFGTRCGWLKDGEMLLLQKPNGTIARQFFPIPYSKPVRVIERGDRVIVLKG